MKPCIRGLKEFKKGCPEKLWNGSDGCPAWVEEILPDPESPTKKRTVKCCLDVMSVIYQRHMLSLLEGNVVTSEKLRNGLIEEDADGKTAPKTHPQIMSLFLGCQEQINEMKKVNDVFINMVESTYEHKMGIDIKTDNKTRRIG